MQTTSAYLFVIAGAALWGVIGFFVKMLAAEGFTSPEIVALRVLTAALCITPVMLRAGKRGFQIRLRDWWLFFGTGVLSLTFFNFCYFNSIQASGLAVAALLLYTAPSFVMLMSVAVFGERFTTPKLIALIATFIGCGLVTGALGGEMTLSFSGLLYGIGSGFGYSLYSIFGKLALKRRYSSLTISAYTFYFALIPSMIFAAFTGGGTYSFTGQTLEGALGLGVLCAVVPYLLYNKGLEGIEAGQAAVIATIEPFVAATIGVLAFGEPLTLAKALGMFLILAAIIGLELSGRRR